MIEDMFIIGDTHFGHKNVIAYENRPFKDVEEMDEALISNWNSVVTKKSKIIVDGDFSFYNKEKTKAICDRLNGIKTLIIGNHDRESNKWYRDCGFENVIEYSIIVDNFWMISHKPLYTNANMPYANIFAHEHGNKNFVDFSSQGFCVSVERIGYTPILLSKIKEKVLSKIELI